MLRIGIECESIEGKNPMWGVGRMIMKLLEEISQHQELEKNFRFILYFKDTVPDFSFLDAPIFEKKITPVPFFKNRLFPIYYFALLPMRLWFERLDWMFWTNYMLPIIAFGKSLVILTEDIYYETREGRLPFRYRLAYSIFCWWTGKFATKILAISETSKKNISQLYGIRPDRIFINYLGIDINSVSDRAITELRQKEGDYLLFVGQAFPRRHLEETILAFKKLITEYSNILEDIRMPKLRLIAVGPDKYETPIIEPLIAQVNEQLARDAVIHKDYVKDEELSGLYAGAKALIYVSDREAFGLPPMEALSFGVPPIIMDNELGHELFGDFAFYAKSGSVDDIAEAIRQAMGDEHKTENIKNNGPEFVKKYNWKNFAGKFFNELV
ncbi:MAG: hypothetical protein A2998_01940 [Candidatus Staskawiczbacteria bacterium RIFCSPLOWO2_01_FULL_37_25b]|uniref:Glycosyl transferase family 1 domain-containing protein n=1 Tax=Candidatus Staskawiczbacteria bacterium RIFCSPLOWO2_01_FULL_37_25b TaxID=1802213 RepID=A0A1G2I9Y7_9BACT|nr:MAG: hypothetical protein A2998_01940 [Candidatus Staskawiczbacteria bacterium RIFCSPLOWO2_01_FULL_37_25b]